MDKFEVERDKYEKAYKQPNYKMGDKRKMHATSIIKNWKPGKLLDIGCGRGEILGFASSKGFDVTGTEIVSYLVEGDERIVYARADELPFEDKSFDYITCLDVIEHLVPETTLDVFSEFKRVVRSRILMTIANYPSRGLAGVELHINIKPYKVWDQLIKQTFPGSKVIWHPKGSNISETWEVILA